MEKQIEYRVKEFQGKFYIQGKFHDTETKYNFLSAFDFAKPKIIDRGWSWQAVDEFGNKCMRFYSLRNYSLPTSLPPFDTLKEAIDKIKMFQSEVKYHYV